MECGWRSPQLEVDRSKKNSDRHKKVIEANDPKADELRNKNIPEAKQPGFDQSQPESPSESF